MIRSFKYRLYPNHSQREALENVFEFCRLLYNSSLEERRSHFKKFGKSQKSLSYYSQAAQLTEIKSFFPEQDGKVFAQVLQTVLKRSDRTFKNFFLRCKKKADKVGYPRFKSFGSFKSILFPQCDLKAGGVKLLADNKKVNIYGIGAIRIKLHRPIQGRCKTVSIKKEGDHYYLVATCDNIQAQPLPATNKTTAIDLGLTTFYTTDSGQKVKAPKPYHTAKEKLAYRNQRLALKKRGSNNRQREVIRLQRAHHKVYNIRNDWQHKAANLLIKENDTIIIEKLNINNMLQAKGYEVKKENISDASWGNFVALLKYKAESAGRLIIEVDPKNTSKRCSSCQHLKLDLSLRDRTYRCDQCKFEIDRDQNAALNILRLGMSLAVPIKGTSEIIDLD